MFCHSLIKKIEHCYVNVIHMLKIAVCIYMLQLLVLYLACFSVC